MQLTIHIEDTTSISPQDRSILAFLGGGAVAAPVKAEIHEEKAAPAAKPAAKAAPPKAEPKAEPEASSGATLEDAVAAATKLVSGGKAAKVKAALADVGAKRVSELNEGDIPAFLAALDA